jgi:DNA polymerase-3 subunit delta'
MNLPEAPEALQATWLAAPLQQLQRARALGRFPAALLIHDERGAGGEALALAAAQLALCRASDPPCGQCRDCRLLASGQHPDFLRVGPAEDSRQIRVEQIRELCEQLSLTSHGGQATVALIAPADSMNANAANALLKTLEEPRAGVTLMLLCALPSRLPATIFSRCQRLRVPSPTRAESIAWLTSRRGPAPWDAALDILGEAPFEALQSDPHELARLKQETERAIAEIADGRADLARLADSWARAASFELRLACLENWLTARIDAELRRFPQRSELRSGAHSPGPEADLNMARSPVSRLLRVLEALQELRRLRLTAINRPLALEQLLWGLAGAARGLGFDRGVVRGS